jgi:glycine/D-amino acid oxidase-like deaminating enzyme
VNVGIIGGGVVGAAIAHRLSPHSNLEVQVFEQNPPNHLEATGAALGVLSAVISSKLKGKHLKLGLESLRLYEALIPALIESTGLSVPYNRHGILQLFFDAEDFARWTKTQSVRQQQGFILEHWSRQELIERYPELAEARSHLTGAIAVGAVYSPQDRQIDPVALTQALIQGATQNGAQFHFNTSISSFRIEAGAENQRVTHLYQGKRQGKEENAIAVDWVIVSAGLGSAALTQTLAQPIQIRPVLGQALHLRCPNAMRIDSPVINGSDIHLVPLSEDELWVGATVEFPDDKIILEPDPLALEELWQKAIALYPTLAHAEILRTWQGLRPRPEERAAPIIERLPGYQNVLIATGHYRNGVLMAPITAQKIEAYLEAAL